MTDNMVSCPNCGGEVNLHFDRCPYCGFINIDGAEARYMEHLEDIRTNLDGVDEEAAKEYTKEVKKSVKPIVITFIILAVLAIAGLLIQRWLDNTLDSYEQSKMVDPAAEVIWEREYFAKLDELYDSEEYEEAARAMYSDETRGHAVYNWKHYGFMENYFNYMVVRDDFIPLLDSGEELESYDQVLFLDYCFVYYYRTYKSRPNYENIYSERDLAILETIRDYMVEVIHERMGFTDDMMNEFENDYGVLSNGIPNRDVEKKICKEYGKQFR